MTEVWKKIPDWPKYEVSDLGSIRRNGKLLKPFLNKWGYLQIDLSDGIKKRYSMHRLVLLTFTGQSRLPVNHKNGIKTDNRLVNLEYVTSSENERHSYEVLGKKIVGRGQFSKGEIRMIRTWIINGVKQTVIAEHLGVSKQLINCIWKRRAYNYV